MKRRPTTISLDRALADPNLLGAALRPLDSWRTWRVVLKAAFGEPLDSEARALFETLAGGRSPPPTRVRELWVLAGRRAGKSRMAALVSAYVGSCIDHTTKLAPGETGLVLSLAPSRAQANVVHDYVEGFLNASPILKQQIIDTTAEEIRLRGNVVIGIRAANHRTIRGPTLLASIFDECAYWRDETSAVPDIEVHRAVSPALASTNGILIGIGSPYRRVGLMHARFRDYYGKDDPDVLVIRAPTTTFNPTIDLRIIERAKEDDPTAALSEWDAEFRSDLSQFLDDAIIDSAIEYGRPLELPPRDGIRYVAFTDASAGRHDAFALGIAHKEGGQDNARHITDVIRGRKPPFDPATVAAEYAALAKEYRCSKIVGDAFAGEWVARAFKDAGLPYERSTLPKSGLYLESLPLFARGSVSIPDHPILIRELRLLERRTHRSGKDSVDHGSGGSDDHANVLAGSLHLLTKPSGYDLGRMLGIGEDSNAVAVRAWRAAQLRQHITRFG
jgi:hypothetical protein